MAAVKKPENSDRTLSLALYLFFGLLVIGSGFLYRSQLIAALYSLETTVGELGHWGPVLLTVLATFWAIFCLPGPVILGFIGTVYSSSPLLGLWIALIADSVASVVGFLVARHLGRERVADWLENKPWFQWLEEQTELRGAYGVFVVRMMPFFPNSLASYAMGLSALRFWPYTIASVLGSIPNLAVYVFGSAGAVHLVREGLGANGLYIALGVVVLTTIVLVVLQAGLRRHGRLVKWEPEVATPSPEDSPSTEPQ